jgi:hypothetical protein
MMVLVANLWCAGARVGRRTMRTSAAVALLALALIGAGAFADEGFNVPKGPCGSAPPAKPQRRTGGEGVPPLPLPATPLRRTERKRPPAPPTLIAKLQYGELKTIQRDGQEVRYYDWNKDPGDAATLVNLANQTLGLQYTSKVGPMQAFEPDPAQYPIFYFTGSDDFQLSDTEVLRLREFLRSGGTIWGDTCFGDPEFFKAFGREMSRVLPDRQWRPLAPDHPLFNCHYKIEEVTYTRDVPDAPQKKGPPIIFGLDLGDRTAVFLSRYDLSCGWDGHIREGAYSVDPNDARRLPGHLPACPVPERREGLLRGKRAGPGRLRLRPGEADRQLGHRGERHRQPAQVRHGQQQHGGQVPAPRRGPVGRPAPGAAFPLHDGAV